MTQTYDEYAAMTLEQRAALARTASGPHNADPNEARFKQAMALHAAEAARVRRRREVLNEALEIASTADSGLTHFATGRALDLFTHTKVRQADDPPDAQHRFRARRGRDSERRRPSAARHLRLER